MMSGGDAADQAFRMIVDGTEVILRITGAGAKNVALMIAQMVRESEKKPTKGKTRLKEMLLSREPLEIYSLKKADLKTFEKQSKEYGIKYTVVHNSKMADSKFIDLLVKKEDSPKIDRVIEKFGLNCVNAERTKVDFEKVIDKSKPNEVSTDADEIADDIVDGIFGKEEQEDSANPLKAQTEKSHPLGHGSESSKNLTKGATRSKKSVKEELKELKENVKADVKKTAPSRSSEKKPKNKKER